MKPINDIKKITKIQKADRIEGYFNTYEVTIGNKLLLWCVHGCLWHRKITTFMLTVLYFRCGNSGAEKVKLRILSICHLLSCIGYLL